MRTTKNVTCCEQAYIKGLRDGGMDVEKIAEKVNRSSSAIYKIINAKNTNEVTGPLKPMGRPPKLSERDRRSLVRYTNTNRRATLGEISLNSPAKVSNSTVRRALHDEGVNNRIARMKPHLLSRHIVNRRLFALEHFSWTMEDWKKVIWTDESTFELGQNSRQIRVWRRVDEEYNNACTGSTFKSGRVSVTVWGAIALGKKSKLVVLDKGRRTAADFVDQVYEGSLLAFLDEFIDPVLMEDGAPVHRSNAPKEWRNDHDLEKMVWPAQSPDMNPLENLWKQMKDRVSRKHKASMCLETFTKAILESWDEITIDEIDKLIMTMPTRISTLCQNKGKSTRW
jgi:transposase